MEFDPAYYEALQRLAAKLTRRGLSGQTRRWPKIAAELAAQPDRLVGVIGTFVQ
jgi:hypothetical protein